MLLVCLTAACLALWGCGGGDTIVPPPPQNTGSWALLANGNSRTFSWTDAKAQLLPSGPSRPQPVLEIYFDKDLIIPIRAHIFVENPASVQLNQPVQASTMEIYFSGAADDHFYTDASHLVSVTFSRLELTTGGKASGTATGTLVNDASQVATLQAGAFQDVPVYPQ